MNTNINTMTIGQALFSVATARRFINGGYKVTDF